MRTGLEQKGRAYEKQEKNSGTFTGRRSCIWGIADYCKCGKQCKRRSETGKWHNRVSAVSGKIISGRAQFHKRLYQIPYSALTTAADGTLVAATDIRWDKCGDGGGIDTVVSRSTDDGENWSYTVANYLGDNGNKFNYYSSAFIDAALVTKGDAIYMACDLYPAAIGLNSAAYAPKTGSTGYDANGNLLLAAVTENVNGVSNSALRSVASFSYHLEKKSEQQQILIMRSKTMRVTQLQDM